MPGLGNQLHNILTFIHLSQEVNPLFYSHHPRREAGSVDAGDHCLAAHVIYDAKKQRRRAKSAPDREAIANCFANLRIFLSSSIVINYLRFRNVSNSGFMQARGTARRNLKRVPRKLPGSRLWELAMTLMSTL